MMSMSTSTATTATMPTATIPIVDEPPAERRRSFPGVIARDTLYLLTGLIAGTITFTVVVTGWSTGFSSLITLIGIPVWVLTLFATRGMADLERRRAALVLGEPIARRYRTRLPLQRDDWRDRRRLWDRFKAILADAQTWRDTAYAILLLPIGIFGFTIATTMWAVTLALLTVPAWWWIPHHALAVPHDIQVVGGLALDSWGQALVAFGLGLICIPVTLALVRGTSAASAAAARSLLYREGDELAERVEHLEETRAGAVDAARVELERVERDLHDGAQARLVAVAMELGRAEQKLRAGDTEAAGELLGQARVDTQTALTELRDLARGIRPALLSERGLDEAVTSLAARAVVPTTVECDISRRLPAAVETATYFVVAEALTNVAKHAQASSAAVRVERRGDRLEVEVRDDGRGGADADGGGLSGLRRRVGALDGTLFLSSPAGGPTILRAELPCGS